MIQLNGNWPVAHVLAKVDERVTLRFVHRLRRFGKRVGVKFIPSAVVNLGMYGSHAPGQNERATVNRHVSCQGHVIHSCAWKAFTENQVKQQKNSALIKLRNCISDDIAKTLNVTALR